MFSPATSGVEVVLRPRHQGGGALVEIIDHGLGMSPERLAQENARLIRRERLDLAPTEVLGLFVVGGLSRRWGIEIALSRTPGGGVTATVAVPAAHLVPGDQASAAVRAPRMQPAARRPGLGEPRKARLEAPAGPAGLPRRVPSRPRGAEPPTTPAVRRRRTPAPSARRRTAVPGPAPQPTRHPPARRGPAMPVRCAAGCAGRPCRPAPPRAGCPDPPNHPPTAGRPPGSPRTPRPRAPNSTSSRPPCCGPNARARPRTTRPR